MLSSSALFIVRATRQNGIRANRKFYREQRAETFLYISKRAFIGTRSLAQRPPPDKCGHRANWQSIRTKSTVENIFPPLKLFALPENKFTFVLPFRAWSPNRASFLAFSCRFPWHPYSCLRELLRGQFLRQCPIASSGTLPVSACAFKWKVREISVRKRTFYNSLYKRAWDFFRGLLDGRSLRRTWIIRKTFWEHWNFQHYTLFVPYTQASFISLLYLSFNVNYKKNIKKIHL